MLAGEPSGDSAIVADEPVVFVTIGARMRRRVGIGVIGAAGNESREREPPHQYFACEESAFDLKNDFGNLSDENKKTKKKSSN
jgi:hypothetical protein